MGLRHRRKEKRTAEEHALWKFERQRRQNLQAEPGQFPVTLVLDHLKPDFNIGKIFRSAHAFGACDVHLIGIEHFDPSPAVGSFKWVPAHFYKSWEECLSTLKADQYSFYALCPTAQQYLAQTTLSRKSAFILGHEEFGIRSEILSDPMVTPLAIEQFGDVDSLNVSVAASISLYEYCKQHSNG
ncbi:MAG: hypothetical protein KDD55_00840 [Bdellovibrionales bacterium]|nr:hypothetical protein [Bdellovibrionales bacterium]